MHFARFIIFVVSATFAYNLQASWDYEVSRGKSAPPGYVEFGLFQRNVDTKKGSFSVASVTTSVYEKSGKEPKTEDALAKKIETLIPNLSWKKKIYKGVHFYTAYVEQDFRYYKMMVKDQGDKRIITMATIRQPYVAGIAIETEYLQRVFLKAQLEKPKGGKKKTALIWENFLTEAQAQMDFSRFKDLAEGWFTQMQRDLAPFRDAARSVAGDARSFVSNVDKRAGEAIGAVNKAGTSLDRAGEKVDAARLQFKESTDKINATARAGIASFDSGIEKFGKIGDEANENWATTNEIVKRFSDPAKVRKLAFNAAIGGLAATAVYDIGKGVGTALVGWIADAAWTGIKALWREITQQLSPEQWNKISKRAIEAEAEAEKQMKKINDLKQKIAMTGMAWSKLRNQDAPINLVTDMSANVVGLQAKKRRLESKLADGTLNDSGFHSCTHEVVSLNKQIFALEQLIPILTHSDSKEALCEQMEFLSDQLIDAEISLQKARAIVAQELLTFPTLIFQSHINDHLDPVSVEKRVNECKEKKESVAAIYKKSAQKNCNNEDSEKSDECVELIKQIQSFERQAASACEGNKITTSLEARAANDAAMLAEVNRSIASAEKATQRILQSNCKAEDTKPHCKSLSTRQANEVGLFNKILQITLQDVDRDCPRPPSENPLQFGTQGEVLKLGPDVKSTVTGIGLLDEGPSAY
ncbi:MAG: hypothetical protein JNM39_16960 [Bdellovibrionaceae bacterium]|nr:hypothetical protein [Pseudobdellovibrionaceae bacterium]